MYLPFSKFTLTLSKFTLTFFVVFFFLFPPQSFAENISFTLSYSSDQKHEYYHRLLRESLQSIGHRLFIEPLRDYPHLRLKKMVENDQISLYWMIQSKERDQKYLPVEVGLTNGLIGNRILFIPSKRQALYNDIQDLDDFRNKKLVGAFGRNWFDTSVWQKNNLLYLEVDGDWSMIYRMLGRGHRGVDYFSRGVNEILYESKFYPQLEIERKLLLIYDRDFRFYLSPSASKYKKTLEKALRKAKKTGLMDRLVQKYWGDNLKQLNVNQRIKIHLKTPE